MLNEVKIVSENGVNANIFVGGKEVHRVTGFNFSHSVNCVPTLELELLAIPYKLCYKSTNVCIANIEDIVNCMDEKMFIDFCNEWHKLNDIKQENRLTDNEQRLLNIAQSSLRVMMFNDMWD